jgi:hypothetical protein
MNTQPLRLVAIEADPTGAAHGAWFDIAERPALAKSIADTPITLFELDQVKLDQVDADFPAGKLPLGGGRLTLPIIKRATYDRLAILAAPPPVTVPLPTGEARRADSGGAPKVGSVVLASHSADDGWWEAVVVRLEQNGATLRLKWRDFPEYDEFTKPLTRVAIPPANGAR